MGAIIYNQNGFHQQRVGVLLRMPPLKPHAIVIARKNTPTCLQLITDLELPEFRHLCYQLSIYSSLSFSALFICSMLSCSISESSATTALLLPRGLYQGQREKYSFISGVLN